jgi:hypothetical protein
VKIARVFPRRTRTTPDDDLTFTSGPGLFPPEVDAVNISVAFTYDMSRAEYLARQWKGIAPVTIGGPGTGMMGEGFVPGMYLKPGYVITSRGCPNRCWFCEVWKRDGEVRELPITEGYNVLDDNLLACSEPHIRSVFAMLKKQKSVEFTGGLEAARLKDWHVDLLSDLKPKQMFFAYDSHDDYEPLVMAGRKLLSAGFTRSSHSLRCFVLIGYPGDTFESAKARLLQTIGAGFMPMAMLWRDKSGWINQEWRSFQRLWARPHIVASSINKMVFA